MKERDVKYGCFIKGMTGALAPFSNQAKYIHDDRTSCFK
jgi:hypothetical protein